ncbi:hypothetical protein HS088_TW10G00556 [Tripterygium wilfordii]|uniref:Uncharacterized protein n=1 Tax=Tripterygium wilfordii TaxID=458696 RepID=A0A7J7D5C4_TRIWF|nr:hypothetical protein HS088_TW10G00556 [Tripterygium wilfordii]
MMFETLMMATMLPGKQQSQLWNITNFVNCMNQWAFLTLHISTTTGKMLQFHNPLVPLQLDNDFLTILAPSPEAGTEEKSAGNTQKRSWSGYWGYNRTYCLYVTGGDRWKHTSL